MQIILHIGQQKTASSTIQAYLAQNRSRLAAQKILYPASLGDNKAKLVFEMLKTDQGFAASQGKILTDLQAEFSGSYTRVILSNENLFTSSKGVLIRLKGALESYATSWRVLCYIRRPDEHIASQYQQKVKGGYTGLFDDFYKDNISVRSYYNYERHLEQWSSVFGQDAVEVRLFHRKALRGSPIDDFMQWVCINPSRLSAPAVQNKNESLDPISTEIVRFLNICEAEHPDLIQKLNVRLNMARLRALDSGERLRLDSERAQFLLDRFREDHERLADRYLSSEDASLLLAPPAEVPPQPPLDREALFDRMMTLFSDRDLAKQAVAVAVDGSSGIERSRRPKKGTMAERLLKQQGRKAQPQMWQTRAFRLIRSLWRSAASRVHAGPR